MALHKKTTTHFKHIMFGIKILTVFVQLVDDDGAAFTFVITRCWKTLLRELTKLDFPAPTAPCSRNRRRPISGLLGVRLFTLSSSLNLLLCEIKSQWETAKFCLMLLVCFKRNCILLMNLFLLLNLSRYRNWKKNADLIFHVFSCTFLCALYTKLLYTDF